MPSHSGPLRAGWLAQRIGFRAALDGELSGPSGLPDREVFDRPLPICFLVVARVP